MALPIDIQDLLHGSAVEWERLELKRGWNPASILHSICAFANDFRNLGGGYICIGVEEADGRPVLPPAGLAPEQLDAIQKELVELGYHAIAPYYHPLAVPYEVDGRLILVLWVLGGQTRPYRCRVSLSKEAKEWAYYIRKGSVTMRATGADETELLSLAATVPFDDRLNMQASVSDLSRDRMVDYLREVRSDLAVQAETLSVEELGRQMGVVGGLFEAPFPLNVGLMMFHPEPWRFFPAMQIDVVWFPAAGPGGDKFSEKTFKGPPPQMLRESLDYLRRNLITETVIKHPDRAESTRVENFPYDAVEEAVVNAVYHRGYDTREPVEIRVEREEMVILSYPGPDRSVRLEQLQSGRAQARRYRNRRIGEFLKELEFTEGRSTGIPKILKAMADNGSPAPQFEFDEDHSYFLVRLPVHRAALEVSGRIRPESGPESGPESEVSMAILAALNKGPLSRSELVRALGHSSVSGAIKRSIAHLMETGRITYTIPDKPNSRLQKYRLSSAG
jgi:ATP-dependent DNA helicase RecG